MSGIKGMNSGPKGPTGPKGPRGKESRMRDGRFYKGNPVIDSKGDIRLFLTKADVACAVKGDPKRCAFANAARRLYSAEAQVQFHRTVAYVELPDHKGTMSLERFTLPALTRHQIKEFDEMGKIAPGGYYLTAPTPCRTLEYATEWSRAHPIAERRKATLIGEKRVRATVGATSFFRNGSGKVKFEAVAP